MKCDQITIEGAGGLKLAAEMLGDGKAMPVLLAHGGGQTRRAWKRVTHDLAEVGFCVIAIDMRGHGESAWSADGAYELADFASDLVAIAACLDSKPAVVGASLGGLAGMIAEGELAPGSFASLTLVDIAPRMEQSGVMRVVGFMDQHVETGFASPQEAADVIAHYMPHRRKRSAGGNLRHYLRKSDDGRFYWHWDPRFMSSIKRSNGDSEVFAHELLTECARAIDVPKLLVRGRMSDVVTEEAARRFVAAVPGTGYVDIADAAHMVAGDRNDVFRSAVLDFLGELD